MKKTINLSTQNFYKICKKILSIVLFSSAEALPRQYGHILLCILPSQSLGKKDFVQAEDKVLAEAKRNLKSPDPGRRKADENKKNF
jgi:hypothetical protein